MDKVYVGIVIAVVAFFGATHCLDCYSCSGTDTCLSPDGFTPTTTCAGSCYTKITLSSGVAERGCAASCVSGERSEFGGFGSWSYETVAISCCSTGNNCNSADKPDGYQKCYSCYAVNVFDIQSDCPKDDFEEMSENNKAFELCKGQCFLRVDTVDRLNSVYRGCVTSCEEADYEDGGLSLKVLCCDGDLCNHGNILAVKMTLLMSALAVYLCLAY